MEAKAAAEDSSLLSEHLASRGGTPDQSKHISYTHSPDQASLHEEVSAGESVLPAALSENDTTHQKEVSGAAHQPTISDAASVTPLSRAVLNGDLEAVQDLLDRGADHTSQDSYGRTSLHLAVEDGNEKLVWLLASHKKGVALEIRDDYGLTALYLAVRLVEQRGENYDRIAQLLLEKGANQAKENLSSISSPS
jgi:ankyrin repeat protein